ncbi:sensor histidine kinase [Sphingobium sp. OAS761]|uniref:sensor histidine kinase n=1 Tax=Sphingobium sp. OAS761 TaxID=2817901 RepID=UPI00209C6F63|nr:histidine kinase dimerization/phosphoacceptor domain -containing protein [Sphingobium sp. OAS761]
MFLILTLALLPLGLIALVASLQAIRTADLEKEALLRMAVTQSARKLTADLASDRTALALTLNTLSNGRPDDGICKRLGFFLLDNKDDGRFYIYDRAGRRLCGSDRPETGAMAGTDHFIGPDVQLMPEQSLLATRVKSANGRLVGLIYYSRRHLESVADPATALQNRQLSLHQGKLALVISEPRSKRLSREGLSLSARIDPSDVLLMMTVRDPPATIARTLSLFLPLVMWFAAAAIGWFVVNRLLIRPLVLLRRAVAGYQPGQVLQPMRRVRTPAREIAALGETFYEISQDVATHEAEMAASLDAQRKLTREVHHRVKNNLQIIASLINLHARSAHEPEAVTAYASIQRRVDALSVVHRNHFAELEEHRGVGVRSLVSELSASLRGTAAAEARRFGIQIVSDNLHISQDVAVPVAFLVTELVELAMMLDPKGQIRISIREQDDDATRASLEMQSPALREGRLLTTYLEERYGRVLTGLSRQLRAPLDHDAATGAYRIAIPVLR